MTLRDSELEAVLWSLQGVVDGEEPVDELSHALQSAAHARAAEAGPELVAAALFHDVARSPLVADEIGDVPHELGAALWLRPRFGDKVAWLAGAHVAAKLFLLDTEPDYLAKLSRESRKSAVGQGAARDRGLVDDPWWPEAVSLRRFDDAAKDPQAVLPEIGEILRFVESVRTKGPRARPTGREPLAT